jgi:hypothetical protein
VSTEKAATFAVDLDSMPAAQGEPPGVTIALMVSQHLSAAGVECSEPTPIDSGASFAALIGQRKLPILLGPAPARPATESGRWFLAIGSGLMPSARLVGFKDDQARTQLVEAVTAALRASPGVKDVEWQDLESWSGRPGRRRWWQR